MPDPDAIHEYPMTMMAVKVVPAFREAAVMALYESTTIAALETATSWSARSKSRLA